DTMVDSASLLGDPSLAKDVAGNVYLSAIRLDSVTPTSSIVMYRTADFGQSWQPPTLVKDNGGVFNDRDWMAVDASNGLHVVRSPHETSGRPVYYQYSSDGVTFTNPGIQVNNPFTS